jgi:uncharacterized protein YeaO (DUF488 family)
MSVGIYRYGERDGLEGLCIGVTRYPPRGVAKNSMAARACYDVWLPLLAPSRQLVTEYKRGQMRFPQFATRYRREMQHPDPRHVIETLAAVAQHQSIHIGCFCADETKCHRTLLRSLIVAAQATLQSQSREIKSRPRFSSPACSMPEIDD